MKKTLFLYIAALAMVFTACDPMSDINDEVEAKQDAQDKVTQFLANLPIAPEAYTLVDDDYALSSNTNVAKYKNFSSSALPKDFLPEILNQKFSGEDAQSMKVTYNFYSKKVVDKDNAYEVLEGDYRSMGQKYNNFSDEDVAAGLIAKLLDRITFGQEEGTEKTVQYTLFSTRQDRFVRINADGTAEEVGYTEDAVEVTDAIYEATGNGKYKNFFTISDALEDLAAYATANDLAPVTYSALVYKNYLPEYEVFRFNGTNWEVRQSVMPVSEELNYARNAEDITQSTWWADPAIKITLGADDYASNDVTSKYSNFDLRSGKNPGTDRAALVAMIGGMLDANHNAVENQQYLVTYAYYDGSSGATTIRIIKQGGSWSEYTN